MRKTKSGSDQQLEGIQCCRDIHRFRAMVYIDSSDLEGVRKIIVQSRVEKTSTFRVLSLTSATCSPPDLKFLSEEEIFLMRIRNSAPVCD